MRPVSGVRYEDDPDHPACSVLGLAQCPCPYASSVCDGELHCHRAGDCLAVTRWAARVFQEIQARTSVMMMSLLRSTLIHLQDHIYRQCWTDSLSSCVGGAAGWGRLLAGVEQFRARHRGQVSCGG